MVRAIRRASTAFNPTRYSWLSLKPKCLAGQGIFWKDWAINNGILDRNGNPSFGKVQTLIKYHVLAAKKHKNQWYVGASCQEQVNWQPEQWQQASDALFRRSQAIKGRRRHGNYCC